MPTVDSNEFIVPAAPGSGSGLASYPLLTQSNVTYLGAFKVPNSSRTIEAGKRSSFQYAQANGIAYNPANNSLFLTGRTVDSSNGNNLQMDVPIAEISIPALVQSSDSAALNRASLIQNFEFFAPTNILNNMKDFPSRGDGVRIGSLYVDGSTLYAAGWEYYVGRTQANPADGGATQLQSHLKKSTDLSDTASNSAFTRVGTIEARSSGAGLANVPTEFRQYFNNYDTICGIGGVAVLGNGTSTGPCINFFNRADVGQATISGQAGVCYPSSNPLINLGPYQGADNNWSGWCEHRGSVWPSGSRSILCWGRYTASSFYDNANFGGIVAGGGTFSAIYMYDALEVKQGFDGAVETYAVEPAEDPWLYSVEPGNDDVESGRAGGCTWDETNNILYAVINKSDGGPPYEGLPIIHAFRIQ